MKFALPDPIEPAGDQRVRRRVLLAHELRTGEQLEPARLLLVHATSSPLGRVTVGIGLRIGYRRLGTGVGQNQRLTIGSAQKLSNIT